MAAKKDKKLEAPASAPAEIEPTPNGPFEDRPGSLDGTFPGGEFEPTGTDTTMVSPEPDVLASPDKMNDAAVPAFIARDGEWVPAEEASAPAVPPELTDAPALEYVANDDEWVPVESDEPITEHYEIEQTVYSALAIPSMRFTDGVHLYQLDEVKSGLFLLRPIGAYHGAV